MPSTFARVIRLLPIVAFATVPVALAQGARTYPDKPVKVVVRSS